jgi:hypothetical protein
MLTIKQVLELISVCAAFISGMTLYYAGIGVSLSEASYGGKTAREVAIRRRQKVMTWVGLPTAGVALLVQVIVILWF